jgi:hypothetical protein
MLLYQAAVSPLMFIEQQHNVLMVTPLSSFYFKRLLAAWLTRVAQSAKLIAVSCCARNEKMGMK